MAWEVARGVLLGRPAPPSPEPRAAGMAWEVAQAILLAVFLLVIGLPVRFLTAGAAALLLVIGIGAAAKQSDRRRG